MSRHYGAREPANNATEMRGRVRGVGEFDGAKWRVDPKKMNSYGLLRYALMVRVA